MKRSLRRAIKESVDNLPSGICFADGNGVIVLCNRQMHRLCHALMGRDLQYLDELRAALKTPVDGVAPVDTGTRSLQFPDGAVWSFRESEITDAEGKRCTQIQALDVTALYEKRVELETENAALQETNGRAKRLYAELDRTVREEETFAMKMRVHDDMGLCLLTARRALEENAPLSELQETGKVWLRVLDRTLANGGAAEEQPEQPSTGAALDELLSSAEGIGVRIRLEGELPKDSAGAYLLITAMRECATNAVRHAGGSEMTVRVRRDERGVTARITNNGAPPAGEITEGGGLSGLRRRVESAGGSMRIESRPAFALTVTLPREEDPQ